jgi:hypothetical protein
MADDNPDAPGDPFELSIIIPPGTKIDVSFSLTPTGEIVRITLHTLSFSTLTTYTVYQKVDMGLRALVKNPRPATIEQVKDIISSVVVDPVGDASNGQPIAKHTVYNSSSLAARRVAPPSHSSTFSTTLREPTHPTEILRSTDDEFDEDSDPNDPGSADEERNMLLFGCRRMPRVRLPPSYLHIHPFDSIANILNRTMNVDQER